LIVGLTVAQGSAAQSLASRIAAAPDGEVRLAFAAREGVCGDGRTFIRDRNRDDYISFEADDSHWKGRTRWRDRPCEDGPVRVALKVRGGAVRSVRTYVGGAWSTASGVTDLGTLAAARAPEALLEIARDGKHPGGDDAIFPATLADSVTAWPMLLRLARDRSAPRDSRRSAVFWVSQAASDAATEGLANLAEDGAEDREIREQAVFALSQLSEDRGVPILLRLATTNRDPAVRRKALFWLGQSEDPRALALFEEILTRK
jgi:hypothetical protein